MPQEEIRELRKALERAVQRLSVLANGYIADDEQRQKTIHAFREARDVLNRTKK